MSHHRRSRIAVLSTVAIALVVLGGCSNGGTASVTPSGPAPESPAAAGIEHPTGASDVVLRYQEGGGFVPPSFVVSQIPHFTLYGDGRVVFRNPALEGPPPEGSIFKLNPARTARLSEEQVQDLLAFALGEGGLAVARPSYENQMVADASTAVFTIDAGGIRKAVSVYALGLDLDGGADAAARAAFAKLAARLSDLDSGGVTSEVYEPAAYRGILMESPGVVAPDIKDWPWPDLTLDDFRADADPTGLQFPHRVMTPTEVDALGVTDYQGGFQNAVLTGPDGKTYTFSLRPLLPDETS